MNVKIFKAPTKEGNETLLNVFKQDEEPIVVSEVHFFDRIDEKETIVLSYYF